MRWIALLLLLLNVVAFLFAHRLPETTTAEPPPANLPRVSMIELLNETEDFARDESVTAGEDCLALTGFLSRSGARDWARVQEVPRDDYRIEPAGVQQRSVFRVVSAEPGSRESLRPMLRAALELGLDAYLTEDASGTRVQAGQSHSLPQVRAMKQRAEPEAGEFALERSRQHLYSFALIAEDQRLTRFLEEKNFRKGALLEVVRCEAIANLRQNP